MSAPHDTAPKESACALCSSGSAGDCQERIEAMGKAALVLGFNELAKAATTLGDKVYFLLFREQALKDLNAMPNPHGYVITFAASEPDELRDRLRDLVGG